MQDTALDTARLDQLIADAYPEMERDLLALLACASVEGEGTADAPFGPEVARALATALNICQELGLSTCNVDGYCGFADLPGAEAEQVGVLAHLDVVPARPEDWTYPPFTPTVVGDTIYGRGAMDDKGPLLAALYGLKALMDLGFKPRKTVRVIMGCNEETHMACMKHYLSKYAPPACGFTPDADWPLIVGEKGIIHYELTSAWPPASGDGPRLLSLECGSAANVVPAKAAAVLLNWNAPATLPEGISLSREGAATVVLAQGTAAHASTPTEGDNALTKLVRFLADQDFAPGGAKNFICALAHLYADDLFGASMGLAGEDERSRTTQAPTMCRLDEEGACLTCDLRFLLTQTSDHYLPIIRQAAANWGLTLGGYDCHEPLWLGEEHPLASILLDSYRQVTGDMTEPLVIGGGTYAKIFPNFLAFGPEPHDKPNLAHQADERITKQQLIEAARIYARALYALAK